MVEAQPRW